MSSSEQLLVGTLRSIAVRLGVAAVVLAVAGCHAGPETPWTEAAASGDTAALKRLLTTGIDPDAPDGHGWTALHWAARSGQSAVIRVLMDAGADVNGTDQGTNGWTPLMHAIHHWQRCAVRTLLEAGADVDLRSRGGATALIMAAGYGQTDIVVDLLERGADPYAEAAEGISALWAAAGGGAIADFTDGPPLGTCFPETIRVLRDRAPDLRLKNNLASRLVGWLAPLRGCGETVRLLRED